MSDLRVPELGEGSFRAHYRAVILTAVLRSAEAEAERHQARGHTLRARRSAQAAAKIRSRTEGAALNPGQAHPWFGARLRALTRLVWLVSVALLALDLVTLGIHTWTTTVADLGVVVLTFVWFFVCVEDLAQPRTQRPLQLELFDPES